LHTHKVEFYIVRPILEYRSARWIHAQKDR